MKALYWRSNQVSTPQLVAVAVLAVIGLGALELRPSRERDPLYEQKLQAARLAENAFRAINVERIRLQIPIDRELDPASSGLIGPPYSPIVSNEGNLTAKQTSANPNFAAAFVEMFHEAGVRRGSVVTGNLTGSFPAMNVAVCAALQVLGARPIFVSSVAASEHGATHPSLTWPDMERLLVEQGILSFRSRAVSMGGAQDRARSHSEEGRELIRAAVERSGLPLMSPGDFDEAVQMRIDLFERARGDSPVVAYVNVGGGTASVGTADDKSRFRPGLNVSLPRGLQHRSVMRHYLEQGVPVVHVSDIREIARAHGLPEAPVETPSAGEGGVFVRTVVPPWAIALVLALILGAMYLATRFDLLASFAGKKDKPAPPEPMI